MPIGSFHQLPTICPTHWFLLSIPTYARIGISRFSHRIYTHLSSLDGSGKLGLRQQWNNTSSQGRGVSFFILPIAYKLTLGSSEVSYWLLRFRVMPESLPGQGLGHKCLDLSDSFITCIISSFFSKSASKSISFCQTTTV